MKINIYKQSVWEFVSSFLQIVSCCLLGNIFFRFKETFCRGDLLPSNHFSLEGIHRFSFSVETKAEPLFQSNKSLNQNFEVKISLCWFNFVGHKIK